jgi:type III secretory pathway component EscS
MIPHERKIVVFICGFCVVASAIIGLVIGIVRNAIAQ